jgi:hypothetical protein
MIQAPTKDAPVVNLEAAQAVWLTIPESFLTGANEAIE